MRRILFVQVSRIGDTMFATPAIRAVAAAYPDAQIDVLAHPRRAELLRSVPFIARVGSITKKTAPWRGRLGGPAYDLALVYGFDEPLVAYATRVARQVVAFRQKSAALNARLSPCVELPPFQSMHAVEVLLRLPAALGIGAAGRRLSYCPAPAETQAARARLQRAGFGEARPLVGLQVASFPTRPYRDWPIERFAELCKRIMADWPQARFAIFGGGQERKRTTWLKERLGARAELYAGRLSLRETAALMSLCHLYVGVDTGPTHIMSTFDVPLVGLFHCTSTSRFTGPLEHPCAVLLDHPHTPEQCTERSSMADIPVDAVYRAVRKALDERT